VALSGVGVLGAYVVEMLNYYGGGLVSWGNNVERDGACWGSVGMIPALIAADMTLEVKRVEGGEVHDVGSLST
jgi:hypothetical protein